MAEKSLLSEFSRKAMQRLADKKIPKKQKLHIPSMDMDVTIRSLTYAEMMDCTDAEDSSDAQRSDKYAVYLSMVEPDLKTAAREIMDAEAGLPLEQRSLLEPLDIVTTFTSTEITEIATQIMKLSGFISTAKVTVVEELKN